MLIVLAGLVFAVASGGSFAACGAMPDDAQRLDCYDRLFAGQQEEVSEFAALCEAQLLKTLVSPAGYRRVSINESMEPVSLDQWVVDELMRIRDANLSTPDAAIPERAALRKEEARMREAGLTPSIHRVTITYDAPNSFNAVLRGVEQCERTEVPR